LPAIYKYWLLVPPSWLTTPFQEPATYSQGLVNLQVDILLDTEGAMLWTIFVVLLVLWLLGLVSSYTLGGFIHILLVLAVVALILQLVSGRRPVV
jgi:hypothetical protein